MPFAAIGVSGNIELIEILLNLKYSSINGSGFQKGIFAILSAITQLAEKTSMTGVVQLSKKHQKNAANKESL